MTVEVFIDANGLPNETAEHDDKRSVKKLTQLTSRVYISNYELTKPETDHTLHARQIFHKVISDALSWMHDLRLKSLQASILAAIHELSRV